MICPLTGRGSASATVKGSAITGSRSHTHKDICEVLGELLADTPGAASSTAVAGGTNNARIESTFHLAPLAFPATVGAFAHLSPFRLPVTVM